MARKKKSTFQRRKQLVQLSKPLWKRLLRAAPVFLLAVVLTLVLSRTGALQQLETAALDFQSRLRSAPVRNDVAIVLITDDDYREMFQNKSPLDKEKLERLIDAVAAGQPKIIGVDIETSAPAFRNLTMPSGVPIVWARTGAFSNRENKFVLQDVLGRREPTPLSGLVMLKEDSDGVVRRYQRTYSAKQLNSIPSLPWIIVKQLTTKLPENEDELFINYANVKNFDRMKIPAAHVVDLATSEGWRTQSPIRDKIVLVGGEYAAQDEHKTPVGWLLGVEVLAQIIETELAGGGSRPASKLVIAGLQIFDGVVLVLLFFVYRARTAFLLALLFVPVLAMLCSLIAFASLSQWAYFVPVLLAVLAQQIYERAKDYRKQLLVGTYNLVTKSETGKPAKQRRV